MSLIQAFEWDYQGKSDWKRAYRPEMFRENIAETLREMTGEHFGASQDVWRTWWKTKGKRDPRFLTD